MPKPNAILAKIEQRYQAMYQQMLKSATADFKRMLQIALQQACDAALMAADDVFDVNEYSAKKFRDSFVNYVNKMANMAVVEDADDPEMLWTKATVDKRLLQIVGKDNFRPWEERYGL